MFAEKTCGKPSPLERTDTGRRGIHTNTRTTNLFSANIPEVPDADNKVDESNIAAFVQIAQQFGRFNVGLGLATSM